MSELENDGFCYIEGVGNLREFAPKGFMEALSKELIEKYENDAIIKISSLPYMIKRCLIKSSKYHGGRDKVLIGAFGEIGWTIGDDDNQVFDDVIDEYFRSCTKLGHVMLLSDKDHDELINLVKTLYEEDQAESNLATMQLSEQTIER